MLSIFEWMSPSSRQNAWWNELYKFNDVCVYFIIFSDLSSNSNNSLLGTFVVTSTILINGATIMEIQVGIKK